MMANTREPTAIAERESTGTAEIKLRMREPLRADIEATAKAKGISMNAEMVQRLERERALAAANVELYGPAGAELVRLDGSALRGVVARATSIDSDWTAGAVAIAVTRETGLLRWALLSDAPPSEVAETFADLIEAELSASHPVPPAADAIARVGNTDPRAYGAAANAHSRKMLGAAGLRCVQLREAILDALSARRQKTDGKSPCAMHANSWGDAIGITKGDTSEQQIEHARRKALRLSRMVRDGHISAAELATEKKTMKAEISAMRIGAATRAELISLIEAAGEPIPE